MIIIGIDKRTPSASERYRNSSPEAGAFVDVLGADVGADVGAVLDVGPEEEEPVGVGTVPVVVVKGESSEHSGKKIDQ